jgi:hypothetical protein
MEDALLALVEATSSVHPLVEDSERVRKSCLAYMQNRLEDFYPERPTLLRSYKRWPRSLKVL